MSAIPIRNIYAMLCYVWEIPLDDTFAIAGDEAVDNIHNLLARLLLHTTEQVVKRGLNRHYVEHEEEADAVRGRIVIHESIRRRSILRKRLVCAYDSYTADIPINQIIKACLSIMSKNDYVDKGTRHALHTLIRSFSGVATILPHPSDFLKLQCPHNNRRYCLLMHICELIIDGLIANESDGKIKMHRFLTDKRMADIYEKFVLKFFQRHLPEEQYVVHTKTIHWRMSDAPAYEKSSLLPQMYPDIVIEDKTNAVQLIIDTKYYEETLAKGYRSETLKARNAHLYQVYTYLSNSAFQGRKRGMLLYPTVSYSVHELFPFADHHIEVRTLNLNQEWNAIKQELWGIGGSPSEVQVKSKKRSEFF